MVPNWPSSRTIILAPTSRGVDPRTLITVARANFCPRSRVRSASGQIWSGPIMISNYQKMARDLHAEACEYRVRPGQTLLGAIVCTRGNLLLGLEVELLCLVQLVALAGVRRTFITQVRQF